MKPEVNKKQVINSLFSLQPLVEALKETIAKGRPGFRKLYEPLLCEVDSKPELLKPIADVSLLQNHSELVEALLSTIFPPSTIANDGLYAVSYPFRFEAVFTSAKFKEVFTKEGSGEINLPNKETNINIAKATLSLAYNIILQKFYSMSVPLETSSIHPFPDRQTGLIKYLELKLNAHFIDVKQINNKFELPANFSPQRKADLEELKEAFPLENFRFEGMIVIDVTDITSEHVIAEIKNSLRSLSTSPDANKYADLHTHVQTLICLKDIRVGITPFFRMNDFYLYDESFYKNSLLFANKRAQSEQGRIYDLCRQMFGKTDHPLLFQNLNNGNNSNHTEVVKYYTDSGIQSLIICPLKAEDGNLIGLLEISAGEPGKLKFEHVLRVQSGMPLFSQALAKTNETLELQVNKTIKEHFTAIQPAVEWRFIEAAFDYLQKKQKYDSTKMPSITFQDVYPLYGSVDIRDSSLERNKAIQLDLREQLDMANGILEVAGKSIPPLALLKELQFKIDKYISDTTESLVSDDEMLIYDFLQIELASLFRHLSQDNPKLKKIVEGYFSALDPQRNIVYHHRKEYEDSITRINDVLDRFIDQEQKVAQEVFPHYFERYVTDGIEFNIYIGQSLNPQRPFDPIYIKNLKLWQFTTLAKAARLTHVLEKRLSLPLQTTQLILTHSIPLTISFRRKERKFDVDGAYNIQYEIIKKRIDKVHLKDSEERLTQPGKIAIVYSQQRELNEYLEFTEYLISENLLTDTLEHLELEDTQGISGLKAIRIGINLNTENGNGNPKVELSKLTTKQLLRK